jgi:hypothetical protein
MLPKMSDTGLIRKSSIKTNIFGSAKASFPENLMVPQMKICGTASPLIFMKKVKLNDNEKEWIEARSICQDSG